MFLPLSNFYLSQYIFGPVLFILSLFIIGIILLQRGKGGGLTGALGGMGGQSAFGVKAGDLFTRITAVAVLLWIFTCALACFWYRPEKLDIDADLGAGAGSSMSSSLNPADFPVAPEPVAPEPVAPEPVAPEPVAPAGTDVSPIPEGSLPPVKDP